MALFPVSAKEREPIGLFKAASSFGTVEGGCVVKLAASADGYDTVVSKIASGDSNASTALHGLADEQVSHPGTMLGRFLAPNASPVVLGPASHLASGKVSVWLDSGWFLTDHYEAVTDATAPGSALNALTASGKEGKLSTASGKATRCYMMKLVNDVQDLLATRVSPAETTGMFAQQAPILIYQA